MVAEVVHGAPCRFADPARFSLAHGGKDRHPYPVPTRVYDETIAVLRSALARARLGQSERIDALRRLDDQSAPLERTATGPALPDFIAAERAPLRRLRRPQRLRLGAGSAVQPHPAQPERVADHRDRREAHGGRREHRRDQQARGTG